MSYFDTVNGFMDNIDSTQNAINNVKSMGFSQGMGELEDKYSLIKQKALQAIPDTTGEILNLAQQGTTALSGTYNSLRAIRNMRDVQKLAKAAKAKAAPEAPEIKTDEYGLPQLSAEDLDITNRLKNLQNAQNDNPAEAHSIDPASDMANASSAENAIRMKANDLNPKGKGPSVLEDTLSKAPRNENVEFGGEELPTSKAFLGPRTEPPPLPPSRAAPQEAEKPEPPEAEQPAPPQAELPEPKVDLPAPPSEAQKFFTGDEIPNPAFSAPESAGANVADIVSEGASKLGAASSLLEAPVAAIGGVLGAVDKSKGAQTASQVINDSVSAKQGGNLAYRGYNLISKKGGSNQVPEESDNTAEDHADPNEAGPATNQADPNAPKEDPMPEPDSSSAQPPDILDLNKPILPEGQDATPETDIKAPEVMSESTITDGIDEASDNLANTAVKGLGSSILETLGADSAGEAVLGALGPVGEIASLGLMLGGIFHDVFGKKKIEQEQTDQENKAQAQEQQAEQNLKEQQAAQTTTSGGIDLASLHATAGANAGIGIV